MNNNLESVTSVNAAVAFLLHDGLIS